ncbi:GerAB/ArcD/ProY family transporter [Clostridium magnum]|uniref:Spore germination protein YndE n=1 Tax=Clostridium magnum DSM 2767 TaxID=1121326 RepID=A0A162TA68_9CLOT|nr:endospore germination permease [Clostridium magnum]KZL92403.1 spore germination protein YndE [Clostridium magnum DSM 2767]SHH10661.1 spore germination protein KB [Clostridium magnum DSM 2767]
MSKGKGVITNRQFRDILICNMWPTAINYGSGILARDVGRDMWISGIISILTAVPFILITIYIGQNFSNKTIVEYSKELLGTLLGKVLGLVLTMYFFLVACSSVSMYIHHLSDFLLPQTPFLVMTVMHVFVICYLVWKGPEVITRTAVIAFSMAIIFYLLVFMASLAEIDINRITPFFDSGVVPVFEASLKAGTFVGVPQILITMILPMVKDQKNSFRSATSGLFIGGFFLVFYFIVELMVMGPQVVALMRIASMDFVRSIQITKYLHRFESFMVALWYWSIMIQAGILTSCSLKAFMQTAGIKKKIH